MYSLPEIIVMNDEAMAIEEAKKLGIVPQARSYGSALTQVEFHKLNEAKQKED